MEYSLKIFLLLTCCASVIYGVKRPVACPTSCLEGDSLVCGSDGQIYASECDLRMKNCGKSVTVVPNEDCLAGRSVLCERPCSDQPDLICGTDSKIYNNSCHLEVEACKHGVKMAHYGACNDLGEDELCPVKCAEPKENEGPICGSNGNIYKSECEMRLQTCGERVVVTTLKHCKGTESCEDNCVKTSTEPVCASDGKIYEDDCVMKQKNCGKHIYEIPMAYCLTSKPGGSKCPTDCTGQNFTYVCGSDGRIYNNECEMRMLTCGMEIAVEVRNMSQCEPTFTWCKQRMCSGSYDPLCGTDGITYSNMCRLNLAKCLRGVRVAHLGVCHNHFIPEVCPDRCPPSFGIDGPVCGSDGNVYSSACEMKRLTCGQKVVPLHLKHCKTTAYCDKSCPNISRPICGSDGNLYKSKCHMFSKNCGKHVYMVPLHYCLRRVFKGCFDICPMKGEPICGSDLKTYSNHCFLRIETCRTKGKIQMAYKGRCGFPVGAVTPPTSIDDNNEE